MIKRLALCVAMCGATLAPATAQDLTDEWVKELALQAILENPQIVMDAVHILREREAAEREAAVAQALVSQRELLESGENAPVLGNPEGDVTLVEFFDYNCGFCRRAKPEVDGVIAADANVRVVLREFPILGEESVFAARAALAAREQGLYEEFHNALMGHPSRLSEALVMTVAMDVGLDADKLMADMESEAVNAHIEKSMALAERLNITGTPAFVIGEQIRPGLVAQNDLIEIIEAERAGG